MPGSLQVIERCGMIGVVKNKRRRLVDWLRACAGRRVGLLTGVEAEGVKFKKIGFDYDTSPLRPCYPFIIKPVLFRQGGPYSQLERPSYGKRD